MSESIRTLTLDNELQLWFEDKSNRYYGDFHRVCIWVRAEISVAKLSLPAELHSLQADLPEKIGFERTLERMGVVSADLERVRETLIQDFIRTSRPYLERTGFLEQLLRKRITEKGKGSHLSSLGN